jgi:polysaccharide biosynthesis/export protein
MNITLAAFICISAVTLGHQNPQTPAQSPTPPVAVSADYVVQSGDFLQVSVARHDEYSHEYFVPPDGSIVFSEVGKFKVVGQSVSQLTTSLDNAYHKVLKHPQVTVVLKSRGQTVIAVLGDVKSSTIVPLQIGMRLGDALAAAGGVAPEIGAGGLSSPVSPTEVLITITHQDGSHVAIQMSDFLHGQPGDNPVLNVGDAVLVDSGKFQVYITGQVKTPGLEILNRGAGLMEAISAGGGVTDRGALSKMVVNHVDGTSETANLVSAVVGGDTASLPKLRAGDRITVPETTQQFAVLGYVKQPDVFPMPEDRPVTLAVALGMAKGADNNATLQHVTIARAVNGKSVKKVYDFSKYIAKADESQNPLILSGDVIYVPQSNHVDSLAALTGAGALAILFNVLRN